MSCDPEGLIDGVNVLIYVTDQPTIKVDDSGTQGGRDKYRHDFRRRRIDPNRSPKVRSVPGAQAGEESWQTPRREKGWWKQEENRTRSSSPKRWRSPDTGRNNDLKKGGRSTTEVGHPVGKDHSTHGNTGGPGRPETRQDNENKEDIRQGRPTREKVKPLPRTLNDDTTKSLVHEPPKQENNPQGIVPPQQEQRPGGIVPPRQEGKPEGPVQPKIGSDPYVNVPIEQKNYPLARSSPSGLTPEQLERSLQRDRPLEKNIVTEAPFIAIATVVFVALAPAGAVGALAWVGVRHIAHAL
jgi:hypothetical protein